MAVIALVAAALSGGAVTRGRLATVGPSALAHRGFAALEVGVPAIAAALCSRGTASVRRACKAPRSRFPNRRSSPLRLRQRLLGPVRRFRPRVPGLGRARRAAGVVLSAGRGLGPGSGSTGCAVTAELAEDEPAVVDLVKAVDLVERPSVPG